jgi:transcriptional regulator with XRE-family HTH domain
MPDVAKIYPLKGHQPPKPRPPLPEPLWREVLGRRLRALRAGRWETLAETAERAGISPQYLSEVERGLKEPSSEMIAALAGALDVNLADLLTDAAEEIRAFQAIGDRASRLDRASAGDQAGARDRALRQPSGPVALALAA